MKISKVCFVISCLFLCLAQKNSEASIYSGEIAYTHIAGLTYRIDIFLYTEIVGVDRPTIDSVHISDGSTVTFQRDVYYDFFPSFIRKSVYSEMHTFPGAGTYTISFILPNRKGNIANIPNSFFNPFATKTEVVVSLTCPNNSVRFYDLPLMDIQHNKILVQNISILNPDHDSLSFELDTCLGESGTAIPGYIFPPGFTIDPVSGEICSGGFPDSICTYALSVKTTEWKDGTVCGYVLRDFVITIHPDTLNAYGFVPPLLQLDSGGNYFQTLNPGDSLSLQIQYFDSSTYPYLDSFGEAFSVGNPPTINISSGSSHTASAQLTWIPDATHSRPHPYIFSFRGSNDIQITDLTVLVYVNGLKPDSCYTAPIGVQEIWHEHEFTIYPNPATDHLTIDSLQFPIDQIVIYNSIGEKVYSSAVHSTSCILHCASFSPGVYFVKAIARDQILTKKFIKE